MNDDLGRKVIEGVLSGGLHDEEAKAIFSVMNGASILREIPTPAERASGIGAISNVRDTEGELLVPGSVYLLRDKKTRILREGYGAGNFIDCYYRVFYIGEDLGEHFEVVEASYSKGVLNGPIFKSQFIPIR